MTNATNITSTTEAVSSNPSEKFINWLIKENINPELSPEENYANIIRAAMEQANLKPKRQSVDSLIADYALSNKALADRLYTARTVINNTLRKMTHGYPPEFDWAHNSGLLTIQGIYRKQSSWGNTHEGDITRELATGATTLKQSDFIKFTYDNGRKSASLSVEFLNNDPMALAQHVRNVCRAFAEKNQGEELKKLKESKANVEEKLNQIQVSLDKATNTKGMKPRTKTTRRLRQEAKLAATAV